MESAEVIRVWTSVYSMYVVIIQECYEHPSMKPLVDKFMSRMG